MTKVGYFGGAANDGKWKKASLDAKWTDAEDDLLLRKWAAGDSISAIARELGRRLHSTTVRLRQLRRQGISTNPKRHGMTWTAEDTKTLWWMSRRGYSASEIASHLARTHVAVKTRLRAFPLSRR